MKKRALLGAMLAILSCAVGHIAAAGGIPAAQQVEQALGRQVSLLGPLRGAYSVSYSDGGRRDGELAVKGDKVWCKESSARLTVTSAFDGNSTRTLTESNEGAYGEVLAGERVSPLCDGTAVRYSLLQLYGEDIDKFVFLDAKAQPSFREQLYGVTEIYRIVIGDEQGGVVTATTWSPDDKRFGKSVIKLSAAMDYVPIQIDTYDGNGILTRSVHGSNYRKFGSAWVPAAIAVASYQEVRGQIEQYDKMISYTDLSSPADIPDSFFVVSFPPNAKVEDETSVPAPIVSPDIVSGLRDMVPPSAGTESSSDARMLLKPGGTEAQAGQDNGALTGSSGEGKSESTAPKLPAPTGGFWDKTSLGAFGAVVTLSAIVLMMAGRRAARRSRK